MSTLPFAPRLANVQTSAIREIFKLLGRPGIISFAGGFPDPALFDIEGIREATHMALAGSAAQAVLQYGPTEGWPALKEAIAVHMAAKGIRVQPDGLITTTGSQQALDLIGKTMIGEGDKVIVEGPTFLATIQCFKLYGADLISAPIDAHGVRVDELERLIIEHKPKLIYLIPSFGNPSGAMLPLERRKKILQLAAQHQVLVVEDDPYGELYFGNPPPPSIMALANDVPEAKPWLAYCGSFSKVLSPGIRVGWMIAPPELLAKATMCKQFSDAHTSNLSQAIAANYLQLKDGAQSRLDKTLAVVRSTYAQRAQTMAACLQRQLGSALTYTQPQGGMFFWTRLTGQPMPGSSTATSQDATAYAKRAPDHGVAFVPGTPFFAVNPDNATLRLSYATSDLGKIEEGVSRLRKAL
jgi:DNA-binding transcriptional MocR family regulator